MYINTITILKKTDKISKTGISPEALLECVVITMGQFEAKLAAVVASLLAVLYAEEGVCRGVLFQVLHDLVHHVICYALLLPLVLKARQYH